MSSLHALFDRSSMPTYKSNYQTLHLSFFCKSKNKEKREKEMFERSEFLRNSLNLIVRESIENLSFS